MSTGCSHKTEPSEAALMMWGLARFLDSMTTGKRSARYHSYINDTLELLLGPAVRPGKRSQWVISLMRRSGLTFNFLSISLNP